MSEQFPSMVASPIEMFKNQKDRIPGRRSTDHQKKRPRIGMGQPGSTNSCVYFSENLDRPK